MIAGVKPYPEYKDSGEPWLGVVPEHWEVKRIRTLFREKDERSGDGHGLLLSLTRARGIVPQTEASTRIASAEDLSKYKVCRAGDLVMNRMQAWSGMFALSSYEGLVSPDYSVFGAIGASEVKYFEHLFKTPMLVDQFAQRSKGIGSGFNRLYTPDFGAVRIVAPPLPEQTAIVRFLDYTDRRIRRYIHAKKRLIALLNEQKQAIIQHAVIRGIDPNVRLSPSGVEWLGNVPGHWEVLRSKYLFREVDLRSVTGSEKHLSMSQRFGLIPSSRIEERRLVSNSYVGAKLCQQGDLILNRLKAHLGVFALAPEAGLISPDYTVLRAVRRLEQGYFELLYRTPACRVELRRRAKGIVQGFWRLYTPDFYGIRVPVPPVSEQRKIVAELDSQLAPLSAALSTVESEVEAIREYGMCLAADVVTGKLDVREAAANLPDEPAELDGCEQAGSLGEPEEEEDILGFQGPVVEVEA